MLYNIQQGDMFQVGEHRIMCGNALVDDDISRLLGNTRPDTLIFDPTFDKESLFNLRPLGYTDTLAFTDHRRKFQMMKGWEKEPNDMFIWDCQTSMYINEWPLIRSKYCLWFGTSAYDHRAAFYGEYQPPRKMKNKRGTYNSPGRNKGKHLQTIFSSPIAKRECMEHPHSKPTDWIRLLIGNCTNGTVYDMFSGSGTSMIACQQLERQCYCMELNPHYVRLTISRMISLFDLEVSKC